MPIPKSKKALYEKTIDNARREKEKWKGVHYLQTTKDDPKNVKLPDENTIPEQLDKVRDKVGNAYANAVRDKFILNPDSNQKTTLVKIRNGVKLGFSFEKLKEMTDIQKLCEKYKDEVIECFYEACRQDVQDCETNVAIMQEFQKNLKMNNKKDLNDIEKKAADMYIKEAIRDIRTVGSGRGFNRLFLNPDLSREKKAEIWMLINSSDEKSKQKLGKLYFDEICNVPEKYLALNGDDKLWEDEKYLYYLYLGAEHNHLQNYFENIGLSEEEKKALKDLATYLNDQIFTRKSLYQAYLIPEHPDNLENISDDDAMKLASRMPVILTYAMTRKELQADHDKAVSAFQVLKKSLLNQEAAEQNEPEGAVRPEQQEPAGAVRPEQQEPAGVVRPEQQEPAGAVQPQPEMNQQQNQNAVDRQEHSGQAGAEEPEYRGMKEPGAENLSMNESMGEPKAEDVSNRESVMEQKVKKNVDYHRTGMAEKDYSQNDNPEDERIPANTIPKKQNPMSKDEWFKEARSTIIILNHQLDTLLNREYGMSPEFKHLKEVIKSADRYYPKNDEELNGHLEILIDAADAYMKKKDSDSYGKLYEKVHGKKAQSDRVFQSGEDRYKFALTISEACADLHKKHAAIFNDSNYYPEIETGNESTHLSKSYAKELAATLRHKPLTKENLQDSMVRLGQYMVLNHLIEQGAASSIQNLTKQDLIEQGKMYSNKEAMKLFCKLNMGVDLRMRDMVSGFKTAEKYTELFEKLEKAPVQDLEKLQRQLRSKKLFKTTSDVLDTGFSKWAREKLNRLIMSKKENAPLEQEQKHPRQPALGMGVRS